jgi:hypothetical protein
MAGPVQSYSTTQTNAQTAFTGPFGLIALVNTAIAAATARGEFNVTVDCSLFMAEDIASLKVYLDSLGYDVEFAAGTNNRSLDIIWQEFLDIPGSIVTVNQGAPGTQPWPVVNEPSTDATITTVIVGTTSTQLLPTNLNRKGIIIQCVSSPLYVTIGSTPASIGTASYYALRLNAIEIENFFGPVSAVVPSGTAPVQVTEKI